MRGRQGLPRTMAGAGLASSGVGAGWPRQHHFWAGAESGPLRCFSSSASFPDTAACPGSLDCALKRRARCPPGAHVCGPCLQPFQEDRQGLCVPRMRQPLGEGLHQPRLEEEIDFLAQELARQEAGRPRLKAPPQLEAQQRPPEAAATLGLSERGQGLDLGLPSTRGPAPAQRLVPLERQRCACRTGSPDPPTSGLSGAWFKQ
ncbi:PREDICTED: neural proliferation differentiation and control protein 1 [Bison bison bison]|uniref:Neural proliferation differentiation and control protein 1 n=1 Tax=Bison bison bison TaxID=43346 RepID=A0A6P3H807_BISBB|nr:PREDICTED: neural proliferation differentiation and control protein 1 [Bison bison bison]